MNEISLHVWRVYVCVRACVYSLPSDNGSYFLDQVVLAQSYACARKRWGHLKEKQNAFVFYTISNSINTIMPVVFFFFN